jgi:hypothetical protein
VVDVVVEDVDVVVDEAIVMNDDVFVESEDVLVEFNDDPEVEVAVWVLVSCDTEADGFVEVSGVEDDEGDSETGDKPLIDEFLKPAVDSTIIEVEDDNSCLLSTSEAVL